MPQNPVALLDEATSPKAIGVKSTRFQEVKKYFYNFIFDSTRGGAIFLNPKMMHKLAKISYNPHQFKMP
jgi:hypothetical protein